MSQSQPPKMPFKRKVFYILGYDPFPPRRYRELSAPKGRLRRQYLAMI